MNHHARPPRQLKETRQRKIAPVAPKIVVAAPAYTDLPGWLAIVDEDRWDGLAPEDIIAAYDHFREVGKAKYGSSEYELARALLRHLMSVARAVVNRVIPIRRDARASECESARQSAMALVRASLTDLRARRYQELRVHFRACVRFSCKDAVKAQFGRSDDVFCNPRLRASLDVHDAAVFGVSGGNSTDEDTEDQKKVAAFLEQTGLSIDLDRLIDVRWALSKAIAELPSFDHKLIVCWSYYGFTPTELGRVFDLTPPAITARLHAFGHSPHLQPFRMGGNRDQGEERGDDRG